MPELSSGMSTGRVARLGAPTVRRVGRTVNRALRSGGFEVRRYVPPTAPGPGIHDGGPVRPPRDLLSTDQIYPDDEMKHCWAGDATSIIERHNRQTAATVTALRRRYEQPLFGLVRVWDLVERLGCCIDPSDQRLYGASAHLHVLQLIDEMQTDGTATPEMLLVALIHDLGKLLLLTGEDPANVVCMNGAVADYPDGIGLDNCMMQWNHDEFAYQRLKDHVPEDVAWLIRYHSLEIAEVEHLMDQHDLERSDRLLKPFAHYDHATKTPFRLPPVSLISYRDVIEEHFPRPITF